MISVVTGNLFDSDAQALVNTVNTVGVMGKGIALQFKEAYPDNYRIYRKACKEGTFSVGQMLVTSVNDIYGGQERYIINFPTKTDWRKPSEYLYIEKGLEALKNEIIERGIKSIAIPPLGSSNGGLNWPQVKEMIIAALVDVDCDIRIYEPSAKIQERMKAERAKLSPARAMLLDVACDLSANGEFFSEFAAEKIVYFLQRFGAADIFKLQFKPYIYGPYSSKVRYMLHHLNGSYISGMSDLNNRPFDDIWLLPGTYEAINEFWQKETNPEYKQIAERTKAFLSGYYSNFGLELLATVDYILQNQLKGQFVDDDAIVLTVLDYVKNWNERKSRLFTDSYVRNAVSYLRQMS